MDPKNVGSLFIFVEGSNDLCGEGSMRRIRPHLILPLDISLFLVDFLNKGLI